MTQAYFLTGTDTEVGKTRVAAALLHKWRRGGKTVGAMKPVASGCRPTPRGLRNADAEQLLAQCSGRPAYPEVNPYAFEPPIAPHIAAAAAGIRIEIDDIVETARALAAGRDRFVVEGVGGWQVPLGDTGTTADLAALLAYPVIVVVGVRLGCINHALLTLESIERRGLPVAGWVANRVDPECARTDEVVDALEARVASPLLGRVPWLSDPSPQVVASHLTTPDG